MLHGSDLENSILFEDDIHSISKFQEQLSYFRASNKLTDVSIIALDGKRFVAHKVVLAASCPYFRQKFENNPKATTFSERTNSTALKLILEFIYNKKIYISNENAYDLHRAASRYQFLDLAYKTLKVMINNIVPQTSLQYWRYSYDKNIENLKQCCLEFIRADTEIFLETHINELLPQEITKICSMKNLSCPIDLLYHYAINIWIKNNFSNRKIYLKQLLSLFDINFLPYHVVEETILSDRLLIQSEDFIKWKSGYMPLRKKYYK